MRSIITWLLGAAFLGINLHALLALGALLTERAKTATQRRAWALRCALSALGFVTLTILVGGGAIIAAMGSTVSTRAGASERATRLAMGISEALNFFAIAFVGSVFPFLAALVLILFARRAARGIY